MSDINKTQDRLGKLFFYYMIISGIMSVVYFAKLTPAIHGFVDLVVTLVISSIAGLGWPISIWFL